MAVPDFAGGRRFAACHLAESYVTFTILNERSFSMNESDERAVEKGFERAGAKQEPGRLWRGEYELAKHGPRGRVLSDSEFFLFAE